LNYTRERANYHPPWRGRGKGKIRGCHLCEEATFLPKHPDHEGLCGDAQIYPLAPPCFSLAMALP